MMPHLRALKATSLLSILLFSLHWADEIARGMEPGTLAGYGGFVILFVWLYATVVHAERRVGLAVVLLGGLLASIVPVLHMQGSGMVGGRIGVGSSGALFWVWTNIALGASGMLSTALAVHTLWASVRRA